MLIRRHRLHLDSEKPGLDGAKLPEAPLASATRLNLISMRGKRAFVEVPDDAGIPAVTGPVHSDYIRLVETA